MKKIEIFNKAVLRLPTFSYTESLEGNWEKLKTAIAYSSTEFHRLIEDLSYNQICNADKRIQHTVFKYYNRATYRSTPYGQFAGLTALEVSPNPDHPITISPKTIDHAFIDWKNRPKREEYIGQAFIKKMSFFSNTTYYPVSSEIRFLRFLDNRFILSAVDHDDFMLQILQQCQIPKDYKELRKLFPVNEQDILDSYLEDMLDIGLLISSFQPNIIGRDYFLDKGLKYKLDQIPYLISERQVNKGILDKRMFRHFPKLIQKLNEILPVYSNQNLEDFKRMFLERFDQNEVPIMMALDPDIGIDYGSFSMRTENSEITNLLIDRQSESQNTKNDQKLKDFFYQKILEDYRSGQDISIDDYPISESLETLPLSNTFSAVVSPVDDLIFLQSIGGATATSLLGRFSIAIPAIEQQCKELAKIERNSNSDILFFDIGYTKENEVDNVNRRKEILDMQLNILNFDVSESPLSFNDIYINIRKGQILLRSKINNKRLIPRFASAYNYTRSDLPIFRLLMDIQNQGIRTDLNLKLPQLFKGLKYYPRIRFANIIVSPATWEVSTKIFSEFKSTNSKIELLQHHLKETLTCSHYRIGNGDQTLLLEVENLNDTEMLLGLLEKHDILLLEEAALPKNPIVVDNQGKPMMPEVILSLYHREPVYKPVTFHNIDNSSKNSDSIISIGKEWLYLEIFCNPFLADTILRNEIKQFIQTNMTKINSWFFIRYDEGGHHLRLRLKLKDQEEGYRLMRSLSDLLEEQIQSGIITDLKVKVYKREIQRYTPQLIQKVEQHFHKDSKWVIAMLQRNFSELEKYSLCIEVMDVIYSKNIFPSEFFNDIINKITRSFNDEFETTAKIFKELNKKFITLRSSPPPILGTHSRSKFRIFKESFINLLVECDNFKRASLMADLMHMHINRIFVSNQRLHEMVIYNCYKNILRSREALRGNMQRA